MRVSRESSYSGQTGRGFRVKVNMSTFKDKKARTHDLPLMVMGHICILSLLLGWLSLAAICLQVFARIPGRPGRSLGEDGTLCHALHKHYGVVMTFDTLSKEFYFIKEGMGENVAEFGLHLFQQVQILQTEYPSRIQQEHMEEVKQDHFYKGLSPEYWQMLVHKVNGENPVTYSELLLTAQKLERWVEVRDPLLPKNPTTGSLNVTHSHSQGNLFPSRKLKDHCTFTACSAAVEDHETEKDSGPKPDREKEGKFSAKEDVGMMGEAGDVDLLLGYIIQPMW